MLVQRELLLDKFVPHSISINKWFSLTFFNQIIPWDIMRYIFMIYECLHPQQSQFIQVRDNLWYLNKYNILYNIWFYHGKNEISSVKSEKTCIVSNFTNVNQISYNDRMIIISYHDKKFLDVIKKTDVLDYPETKDIITKKLNIDDDLVNFLGRDYRISLPGVPTYHDSNYKRICVSTNNNLFVCFIEEREYCHATIIFDMEPYNNIISLKVTGIHFHILTIKGNYYYGLVYKHKKCFFQTTHFGKILTIERGTCSFEDIFIITSNFELFHQTYYSSWNWQKIKISKVIAVKSESVSTMVLTIDEELYHIDQHDKIFKVNISGKILSFSIGGENNDKNYIETEDGIYYFSLMNSLDRRSDIIIPYLYLNPLKDINGNTCI